MYLQLVPDLQVATNLLIAANETISGLIPTSLTHSRDSTAGSASCICLNVSFAWDSSSCNAATATSAVGVVLGLGQ